MGLFLKALSAALLAVIMMLVLRRQEFGVMLAILACAMIGIAAAEYIRPVRELLETLRTVGELDGELMAVLMKAVGISIVTEIASLICADSGSGSLGKMLQLLGTAVVLWLSIPLFTSLVDLIQKILEGL